MARPKVSRSKEAALSVRERFEAAVHAYRQEHPATYPPIAVICRLAGLNRSNIYATHPDLVATIRPPRVRKQVGDKLRRLDKPSRADATVENEKLRFKALLYVCLELRAEVENLRLLRESDRRRST